MRGTGTAGATARPARPPLPRAVLAVTAMLLVTAGALWSWDPARRPFDEPAQVHLSWWAVAVLAAVCELVVMVVQLRREAHGTAFTELAIALGLYLAGPQDFVLGRLAGSLFGSVVTRRQRPAKTLFNSSLNVAESVLALAVFHAVRGDAGRPDPRSWLAVGLACLAVGALATLAVSAVIALVEKQFGLRATVLETCRGAGMSLVAAAASLLPAQALAADAGALVPLACWLAILLLVYRAYSSLTERYLGLERLHRFSRAITDSPEADGLLHDVLDQARDTLLGERAEAVFLPPGPGTVPVRVVLAPDGRLRRTRLSPEQAADPVWTAALEGGGPLLLARGSRDPAVRAFLDGRGLREALLAPLAGELGTIGTLLVGDRMGAVRPFDERDTRLFATVTAQAGLALRHGELAGQLRHQQLHDALTGLPHREELTRRLSDLVGGGSGIGTPPVTVLAFDLVGFGRINDSLGQDRGDRVLAEAARRTAEAVGDRGVVGRYGSDELVAVLPGVPDLAAALDVVRDVQDALDVPVATDAGEVAISAWVGIAQCPAHGTDPAAVVQGAVRAAQEAKHGTIGWQVHHCNEQEPGGLDRLTLLSHLRRGLPMGELDLYVQPQAVAGTGEVVAAEALVRWRHPERGLLFPDTFVPLAEQGGLIGALTSQVLRRAVEALARWQDAGNDLRLGVNLSVRSLQSEAIVAEVAELLGRYGVAPSQLVLEITESSFIRDPARTRTVLESLHQLGVRLSVDDFGTGYATLTYLRELPLQELKIDKRFVWGMVSNAPDEVIVRSVVQLGHDLGLTVVAEGIEDAETWDTLAALGCTLIQGYHLARPMPVADFDSWLHSWRRRGPRVVSPRVASSAPLQDFHPRPAR